MAVGMVVGSVLFLINQAHVVLAGRATPWIWLKVGLTYRVPFCVANHGIVVATGRHRSP